MELYGWEDYLDQSTLDLCESLYIQTNKLRQTHQIFPPQDQVFRALSLTKPTNVKVVILGQDPYHGFGQATGLSFSVSPECKIPPSLRNMYKEYESDLGTKAPKNGDLSHWAAQGVLMLNTTLTVVEKSPQSHAKLGWDRVTSAILAAAFKQQSPNCHVALAWGMPAVKTINKALKSIDEEARNRVYMLSSTHPSPLSATNNKAQIPAFIGSKPYTSCNDILTSHNIEPIAW